MIYRSLVSTRSVLTALRFPNSDEIAKKGYVMPEREYYKTIYKPERDIHFKNGRYLIYLNKQNLATPFLLDLHFTAPMTYIAYLIYTNPFYLTFPAALPLMFMVEGVLLLRWLARKGHFKKQIERIYLLSNGMQIEILYSNKIRRIVKDNEMESFHIITRFEDTMKGLEQELKVEPVRGLRFPTDPFAPFNKVVKPLPLTYGWTVRDRDFNNYILPSKFDYADWEILSKVLNGYLIDLESQPLDVRNEGIFTKHNVPSIEEQYEAVKGLHMSSKDLANKSTNSPS